MFTSFPLIAVVDDDRAVVQIVTAFLESQDYRTVSCFQAAEAIPLIHSVHPDLVLLDIQMEQWDAGLKLLAALRDTVATRNLPVIVCSANLPLLRQQEQSGNRSNTFSPWVRRCLKSPTRLMPCWPKWIRYLVARHVSQLQTKATECPVAVTKGGAGTPSVGCPTRSPF
jgi:CheY-like chemotaxis protein